MALDVRSVERARRLTTICLKRLNRPEIQDAAIDVRDAGGHCAVGESLGMARGGGMSGVIFDFTGSYQAAFLNGLAWNLLNLSVALWLLTRPGRSRPAFSAATR